MVTLVMAVRMALTMTTSLSFFCRIRDLEDEVDVGMICFFLEEERSVNSL